MQRFDQAVLKIKCFYLDETIQKRFCFSWRGECLRRALHHRPQPLSQVNESRKYTQDFLTKEMVQKGDLQFTVKLMVKDKDTGGVGICAYVLRHYCRQIVTGTEINFSSSL